MDARDREWIQNQMNKMHNYLIKIGASAEDAKDIVQETFYKSLLYADSIPSDKLASWLFKVAINAYYDLCKKLNKQIPFPIYFDALSEEYLPEEITMMRETQKEIETALQELSPVYKELLEMRYKEEMSYQEIGTSMKMKKEKVKTYLARAKKQFLKRYGRQEDHE